MAIAILAIATQPVFGQNADDARILLQLGFVAGQAVACDIEKPDVAAKVATAMADAMGLTDEASHRLMTEQALLAAAQPCAAPIGRLGEISSNWKAMRKRAGLD